MAATEASTAPAVQEDAKTPESKQAEAEQPSHNSESVQSQALDKDKGSEVNSGVNLTKETVDNDASVEAGASADDEEEAAASGGEAPAPRGCENHEHKTSLLDSFLNKSGLGKVMSGRKKKEASATSEEANAGAGSEEADAGAGSEEPEKAGELPLSEGGAEGGSQGEGTLENEKTLENGEKEHEKKCKESKSSVRDLIRKPVAKIFSHRSTEKKEGNDSAESPKQVQARSKSLDRLEDPQALHADDSAVVVAAAAEGAAEADHKASTKHMKRWHSFKKLMAQKAHKRSAEDGGEREGGGDSSTLDSKESGQKRWKLKRSWTFQGLKRDTSMVGISGKTKSSDKPEEAPDAEPAAEPAAELVAEPAAEPAAQPAAEPAAEPAANQAQARADREKAEASEDDKVSGGASVTQHANEIWTSFKKRVIPKSRRANTECQPGGDEDAATTAAASAGEADGAADDGKDGKSAKAKRSHFGRAVSLKNFILRKGKSTSVDMGDGAKEEDEEEAATGTAASAAADTSAGTADSAAAEEDGKGNGQADGKGEKHPPADKGVQRQEAEPEAQKTPGRAPVTNGQNGCENGTAEDEAHNHREGDEKNGSPVKKSKEMAAAKEETNAKVINTAAPPVNSDKKAGSA
ncbi:uncharacterized protein DDB_G0286299 isoform X2 [Syngnathus scovelli]|uniref:uncharacterized protein DDB_G0286299 isoform X2 n=1 Tax=Syngnathus scovelli TaxID=161590 RepID=UPI002110DBA7|nr:translation initiation factor IF-2 isoform X2 [Syngnathus scovelli]